jgi:hypothetical protein
MPLLVCGGPGHQLGESSVGQHHPFLSPATRIEPCPAGERNLRQARRRRKFVPNKRPSVKNEKQYERLKEKGMSKQRAARIANAPGASRRGGKQSGSGGSSRQGGTTAQKKAAGRKGGRSARKS